MTKYLCFSRQNYAESSDDEDSPVPPKVLPTTNNQLYVPKGKPFAMQQHSVAKGARNSEESEDSSSEEGDHGSPDEKCFATSNSRLLQESTRSKNEQTMPTEKIEKTPEPGKRNTRYEMFFTLLAFKFNQRKELQSYNI